MASTSTYFTISPHHHHHTCNFCERFTSKPSFLHQLYSFHGSFHISTILKTSKKLRKPRRQFASVVMASANAGIRIPGVARPGGVVESDKLPSDVRKKAMDAVEFCRGRVTIGDVASRAGLKLNEAQKALQALAADTGGFLEVSDEGDILYVFPKDYRAKLTAKSFQIKMEPLVKKATVAAEYIIRVSFGTALIASILIVYTAIIAILSSRSDEDNRDKRGGKSYNTGFTFYISPRDLFWYWDPYYYRGRQVQSKNEGMNFVDSVFSFVFGDGDPNQGIQEERWKLIGEYIASNGGVVTAEELAPYLDLETADMSDESYVLPVLLQFDGHPVVDDEGHILYRFSSLQRTAFPQWTGRKEYVGRRWSDWVGGVQKFLKEKKWRFSKTSNLERAIAVGLGGLNLFGVIILSTLLRNTTVRSGGSIKFVAEIFPFLQIYAGAFFAIPLIRWFFLSKTNSEIHKRNRLREQQALAVELPDRSLRRKLLSARDMAQKTVIGQDRILYRTDRDLHEQDYEAREWDQRFKEIENSD